jgi:Amidase
MQQPAVLRRAGRNSEPLMEPCDLDASEARQLIGAKKLSPVELLESCIRRIETIDPAVNAMVARDFERAAVAAREAEAAVMRGDPLGPLHGLPVGIKDLEDTAGLRTTYGSVLFKDHVPQKDQRIVRSVREAGAIVVGKTNTPEWGAGANTRNAVYGVTGNPFSPHGADRNRLGYRWIATQPRRIQRHRRVSPLARAGTERQASARLEPAQRARAYGAYGAGSLPATLHHGWR